MISDILADAIAGIRGYQRDLPECYDGIKKEIDAVVATMDALRHKLDSPPPPEARETHEGGR